VRNVEEERADPLKTAGHANAPQHRRDVVQADRELATGGL
jgi:hypothetical protein